MKTRRTRYVIAGLFAITVAAVCLLLIPQSGMAQSAEEDIIEEIFAQDLAFDLETGEISYKLEEPARVRLRIGLSTVGPMLHTIYDWEEQEAGEHRVVWDFKDASGKVFFGQRSDFMVALACIPVSDADLSRYRSTVKGYRQSPGFRMEFPESTVENDVPQIKDRDPIRITIDGRDQMWLTESKYEVGLFIDYVFLMEEEEGINPFTYEINTRGLREGRHKITANIVGYEGEIGAKTVLVDIVK